MNVDYWLDPICPWCWMTSRWIIQVAPLRRLDIRWLPISLLRKNAPPADDSMLHLYEQGHHLLRVMESVRAAEGDAAIGAVYTVFGSRIHEDHLLLFDIGEALAEAGVAPDGHVTAGHNVKWDDAIAESMDDGIGLVGNEVGTPIIAFTPPGGERLGMFGPVISRHLPDDEALRLWDGVVTLSTTPGFWELKRTRTERPESGYRTRG